MADTPWGAIIEGGSNIISSGIQALTQPTLRQQRKSQQKYDRWYQENITEKNMALENQYAIDAEKRQNAYNDPSAVSQRYRDAGLSPQAMLSGASGAGIQAQMGDTPDAGGSGGYSPKPMAITPDLSGLGEMYNQSKRLENDTLVAEAQAYKLRKEGDRLSGQESRDGLMFDVLKRKEELGVEILDYQRRLNEALFDTNVEKGKQELENLRQDFEEKKSRIGLNEEQKKWYTKSIDLIDKQIDNTEADTEKKNSESSDIKKDTEKKGHEIALLKIAKSKAYNEAQESIEHLRISRGERIKLYHGLARYLSGMSDENSYDVWKLPSVFLRFVENLPTRWDMKSLYDFLDKEMGIEK